MSKRYIKKFESFQDLKRRFEKVNEAVVQFDDKYRVGGIEVSQSFINSYVKKVKQEANKNLRQLYSDQEIAELVVKYVADQKLDPDKIPATALLGGNPSMEDDIDMDAVSNTDVIDNSVGEAPMSDDNMPIEAGATDDMENQEGVVDQGDVDNQEGNDNQVDDSQPSDSNDGEFVDNDEEENELPLGDENDEEQSEFNEPSEPTEDNQEGEESDEENSEEESDDESEENSEDEEEQDLPI